MVLRTIDRCLANDRTGQRVALFRPASRWSALLIEYASLNKMPAGWLAVVLASFCAATAVAQRVQFPTMVPGSGGRRDIPGRGNTATGARYANGAGTGHRPDGDAPGGARAHADSAPTNDALGSDTAAEPAGNTAGRPRRRPLAGQSSRRRPGTPTDTGPPVTTPLVPSYSSPPVGAAGQPPALYPGGAPWSGGNSYAYTQPGYPTATNRRLLQDMRFETTWMPSSGGSNKFGIFGLELFGTFGFPMFGNVETPLLVTPGFAFGMLSGPVTTPENQADMPSQLYDAYLDFAWGPKITPWLAADLGFRFGVYSDFSYVDSRSVRLMGRGARSDHLHANHSNLARRGLPRSEQGQEFCLPAV